MVRRTKILDKLLQRNLQEIAQTREVVTLSSLLSTTDVTAKKDAQEISAIQSGINLIANTFSTMTIKLYRNKKGKIEEVLKDNRIKLINDDTGDTLTATQFWRAMIEDYFLGSGGFAYIKKEKNKIVSLHYVPSSYISIIKNTEAIDKDYKIKVSNTVKYGYKEFESYDFLKIFRRTEDGATNIPLQEDNPKLINLAYSIMEYETSLISSGGNKRGFITLEKGKRLTEEALSQIRESWKQLYSNNTSNIVVLNEGLNFHEASNTSVELQLNDTKKTVNEQIYSLLNIPINFLTGNQNEQDTNNFIKFCLMPIISDIECSLDRDLLLEKEKGTYYFAVDLKELTRGNIKERYEAYKYAVDAGWINKNEIRKQEDFEQVEGLDTFTFSLGQVFYNADTKEYYTPNTDKTMNSNMSKTKEDKEDKEEDLKGGDEDES